MEGESLVPGEVDESMEGERASGEVDEVGE